MCRYSSKPSQPYHRYRIHPHTHTHTHTHTIHTFVLAYTTRPHVHVCTPWVVTPRCDTCAGTAEDGTELALNIWRHATEQPAETSEAVAVSACPVKKCACVEKRARARNTHRAGAPDLFLLNVCLVAFACLRATSKDTVMHTMENIQATNKHCLFVQKSCKNHWAGG